MPDSIAVLQVRLGPTVRAGEEEETDKHRLLWRLVQFLRAQGTLRVVALYKSGQNA